MSEFVIWTQPSGPLCLWQCFDTMTLINNQLADLSFDLVSRCSPLISISQQAVSPPGSATPLPTVVTLNSTVSSLQRSMICQQWLFLLFKLPCFTLSIIFNFHVVNDFPFAFQVGLHDQVLGCVRGCGRAPRLWGRVVAGNCQQAVPRVGPGEVF